MPSRYICIHGHFYQPPRENPWIEEVEVQDSAAPYHDWNERITAECYGPNATARILDDKGRILEIVNNYSRISFNMGPTLLSWMEREAPDVYASILEADRLSLERFHGHGSALAQVYNHMIMPLANARDKRTQLVWGIKDFRRRFGREPEGVWLAETAVDTETLDVAASLGIRFTILAPRQCARVRPLAGKTLAAPVHEESWQDVSGGRVDPTTPYKVLLPSGRSIVVFFYDGPISQALAFEGLLKNGSQFYHRLKGAFNDSRPWPQLVHIATDGESYGHHHAFGEMALAWCLEAAEQDPDVEVINYGAFLDLHPPIMEAQIVEDSSWSCIHGVERWRSDCGCNTGGHPSWNQAWRKPLREAMNWLRDQAASIFEEHGAPLLKNPWAARDRYIDVILNRSPAAVQAFLQQEARGAVTLHDNVKILKLMEMQRFAQLIFTSCAWFFDEISGIETVQNMQYAVRTIQLAEDISGRILEEPFKALLKQAPSNVMSSGLEVYESQARPAQVDMLRVSAHFAIVSLFQEADQDHDFACYAIEADVYERTRYGRSKMATGKASITSRITGEHAVIQFAVLHLGDHTVTCGATFYSDPVTFRNMVQALREPFDRGDIVEAIRLLDKHFGRNTYSINHLFRDEQRLVVNQVLAPAYSLAKASYRQIFESNYSVLNFLDWLHIPPPAHVIDAARYVVGRDLMALFAGDSLSLEELRSVVAEFRRWGLTVDDEEMNFTIVDWVRRQLAACLRDPDDLPRLQLVRDALEHVADLPLNLASWRAQTFFFALWNQQQRIMRKKAAATPADPNAQQWLEAFSRIGKQLRVEFA
ncbi:DUF3536 domain-containing protein [Megalodesulfovibrio paquesii]